MESKGRKLQYFSNKYIVYIIIIFVFVLLPASILTYSVFRYYQIKEQENLLYLKGDINRIVSELRNNLACEKYFCGFFHDYYISEAKNNSSNIKDCAEFCKNLRSFYNNGLDFVLLDNNGNVKYNSNPDSYCYTQKEWYDALNFSRSSIKLFFNYYDLDARKYDSGSFDNKGIKSAKKILGSRIEFNSFFNLFQEIDYHFMRVDNSGLIPPCAVYEFKWGGLFLFFSKKLLNDSIHLRSIIKENFAGKKYIAGLYNSDDINDNFWIYNEVDNYDDVKKVVGNFDSLGRDFIETNSLYFNSQFLTNNKRFFIIAYKDNSLFDICWKSFVIFILYLLLSIPIIRYFWNTIILGIPGKASIRLKLAFLFLFASGIPLLSLAVISYEYQLRKRLIMIEDAKTWITDNLCEIDQRYLSYLTNVRLGLDKYLDKWSQTLKKDGLNINSLKEIDNKLTQCSSWDYFCVASEAQIIASFDGLVKYSGSLDQIVFDEENSIFSKKSNQFRAYLLKVINVILKKICSDLNNKAIPAMVLSKLEIFIETIMQKTFPEILYSVIQTKDNISGFGFKNYYNVSYFKFISIFDKRFTDYICLITWLPKDIQRDFLKNIIHKINRNPVNYKLISYERGKRDFIPSNVSDNKVLEKFIRRASDKPTDELEIINVDGEDYIAVSILGHNISEYSFVGLYPIKNIDSIINFKSVILWILGVFSLLLSISLAQLLTKSFINPMNNLQEGAYAVENRNFDHRISNLGNDEFGDVGNIFNNMMGSLKELEVAKIVQESMFPKPEFKQGNFSVYGKSITMIDVGGDYLDFFKVDDNSFSLLLGDVAGHGLGAAMIMAMAKASIIASSESWKSPSAMLNLLHKVILGAKSAKQKKIMTFQYLYINSNSGENLYGNAGACSPFLVRHSENKIEEIKMAGAALGAFKKASYKEKALDFRPGDAMVFYTDGIVECKDKNGEMLGYDNLKNTILQCWDSNPETYYNNILQAYYDYVGVDAEAGDDLTFVILMFNK